MATKHAPAKVQDAVRRARSESASQKEKAASRTSEVSAKQQAALLEVDLGRRCALASAVAWAMLATMGTIIYLQTRALSDPLGFANIFGFILPLGPGLAGLAVSGTAYMSKRGKLVSGHYSEYHNITMFGGLILSSLVIGLALGVLAVPSFAASQFSYPLGVFSITLGMLGYILAWTEWSSRKMVATLCAIVPTLLSLVHFSFPPGQLALVVWEYHVGGALFMVAGVLFVVSMTATTGAEREIVRGANERLAMEATRIQTRNRELDKALAQTAERAAEIEEEIAKAESDGRAAEERLATAERLKAEAIALREKASAQEAASSQSLSKAQAQLAAHEARARELAALDARAQARDKELGALEQSLTAERTKIEQDRVLFFRDKQAAEQELAHARREREAARASLEAAELKVREAETAKQAALDLRSNANDASRVADARATHADQERAAALARVEQELVAERQNLEKARQKLAEERARVERAERDAAQKLETVDGRARELERIQLNITEKINEAAREKTQAEALRRKAQQEAADAAARAEAYTKSFAEVKDLESRTGQAQTDLKKAQERMAAQEKKLKDYEQELARRSEEQLQERKGFAAQKERLASQEARLKEREAALFELESTPDFAREALAAIEQELGEIAPRVGAALGGGSKGAKAAAAANPAATAHAPLSEPAAGRFSLGNGRLDELIGGGIPQGASLLVVGPAFCGKESIPLGFVADGLERSVPSIIVTTVRSPAEVADELTMMVSPAAKERVKSHLRWVDASGKGQRGDLPRDHIVEVVSPADFAKIKSSIANHFEHLGGKHPTFRFVYMPLTESWRHAEPEVARTFLQQLVSAVRKQGSGAIFVAESGIHSSDEVEALAGMVQGVIRCQEEREGHALRAQGIPGTRSSQWVRYRHTPRGIELGSFELERIR